MSSYDSSRRYFTQWDIPDSWFAGFTGSHLAVAWIGRDDNKVTGLWGRTGGLQAWISLFRALPSQPLALSQDGLEMAWVDIESGQATQAECPRARQLPFAAGTIPAGTEHCVWQEIKTLFSGGH